MTDVPNMRDHWWWRPGWTVGRSFYTWHITFEGKPEALNLVEHYTPLLDRFDELDQVGISGLHLTTQGLGFTDEVSRHDVDLIVDAARVHLSKLSQFTVGIGPAHVDPETVQMPVNPLDQLTDVRLALRNAIADVWGPTNVPENQEGFRPHVTLAYSNAAWSGESLVAAVAKFPPLSAEVDVDSISLIDLNRDAKRYEWDELATVPLRPIAD